MKTIKYIDLFGGMGGFSEAGRRINKHAANPDKLQTQSRGWDEDKGKETVGNSSCTSSQRGKNTSKFRCVGYYEINKHAVQVYNKKFKTNYKPIDIRTIREFPDFDLLCAGFPCPSFSIAGKRKGFDDERGSLFFEICRIIRQKRPKYILLENVKGLLSAGMQVGTGYYIANKGEGKGEITSNRERVINEPERGWEEFKINVCKGYVFTKILNELSELGYDIQGQVLNSKYWVPQNRERIFLVGHLRGEPRPEIFPITKSGGKHDEPRGEA